ncbi:MAG: sensor histidine kinase [Deltaproteobacteria bacterium]|nr:sensor histidine kinase [Deltaproteobacteria bacterium]
MFRILIDNALKYGGENLSNIRIGYEEDPKFHIFSFRNDGESIKEEDREKKFERFQRNGSSRGVSGSGLGLAIVKEVAERPGSILSI